MKVGPTGPRKGGGSSSESAKKTDRRVEGPSFRDAVEAAAESQEKGLDQLLVEIEEAGALLAEKRTYPEMVRFRDLVRDFMKKVVGGAYRVEEVTSALYLQNQKVFIVARKVEEGLETLATRVLSDQAPAMEILRRTEEIRGLLLDLRR